MAEFPPMEVLLPPPSKGTAPPKVELFLKKKFYFLHCKSAFAAAWDTHCVSVYKMNEKEKVICIMMAAQGNLCSAWLQRKNATALFLCFSIGLYI